MILKRPDRTMGARNDTFWEWCDQGELHLPRCNACQTLAWPIEPTCTTCDNTEFTWERLSGQGEIVSWCTFERDYYQGQFPMPWECILVALDEGPLFISNPDGLSAEDLHPGIAVTVHFIDAEDAAGPFKLPVFRPRSPSAANENTFEIERR